MAFVTTFVGAVSKKGSNAYNVDFSVGPGVRGNQPVDIMLVQALLRIAYFEINPSLPKPAGQTGIEVDGRLTPQTLGLILATQRFGKAAGIKVRLDGIFDPFRSQGEFSKIAKVRYVLELLNDTAFQQCRNQGLDNFDILPARDDIPVELKNALNAPRRDVARQYEQG